MKVFRITGEIRKPNLKTSFKKEVVAIKPEHAIERIYAELGSKHRVKRSHIKILDVSEAPLQDVENPSIKKLIIGEDEIGEQK